MLLADPGLALGEWRARYRDNGTGRRGDALRRARARRLPAAHGADRLHGERGDRRPLRRVARGRYSHRGRRTRRPTARISPTTIACRRRGARARRTTSTRPPSARGCRWCIRSGTCARPVMRSPASRVSSRARSLISSNVYDGRVAFSEIVQDARRRGFTEPDPRDDLSGMDVGAQAHHPGARDGPDAGAAGTCRWRAWCPRSSREARSRSSWRGPAPLRHRHCRSPGGGARARQGAALHRHSECLGRGRPWDSRSSTRATRLPTSRSPITWCVFATRRYCDNPLIVQGPGAGTGGHRRRGVRRPAATGRLSGGRGCESGGARARDGVSHRPRWATSPSASDILGFAVEALGDRVDGDAACRAGCDHQRGARHRRGSCRRSRATTPPGARCWRCSRRGAWGLASRWRSTRGSRSARGLGGLRGLGGRCRGGGECAAAASVQPARAAGVRHGRRSGGRVGAARHVDNIAPSLYGGLVLTVGIDHPRVKQIPVAGRDPRR